MKVPVRTLGLAAAALLLGSALAPVSAQQSGVDGQVALRSDGALYLIVNGQRRWISTLVLPDEQINAIPEGEPILVGLALAGSSQGTTAAANPSKPATGPNQQNTGSSGSTANSQNSTGNASNNSNSSGNSRGATPSKSDENLSTEIPVEVDIEDSNELEQGESRKVEIKTKNDATCELVLRLPDNKEVQEDSQNAKSGKCRYTIDIPENASTGNALLIGTVREGGKVNRQEVDVKIVKKK